MIRSSLYWNIPEKSAAILRVHLPLCGEFIAVKYECCRRAVRRRRGCVSPAARAPVLRSGLLSRVTSSRYSLLSWRLGGGCRNFSGEGTRMAVWGGEVSLRRYRLTEAGGVPGTLCISGGGRAWLYAVYASRLALRSDRILWYRSSEELLRTRGTHSLSLMESSEWTPWNCATRDATLS